jgi:citrate synthase
VTVGFRVRGIIGHRCLAPLFTVVARGHVPSTRSPAPGAAAFSNNECVSSTANLGLEGVVAFETEIAEPDKEGSSLRYRGVDIEELAGKVPFEEVWGLIVNESLDRGLPIPAPDSEPVARSGDARVDLQASLPVLAPVWGLKQLSDLDADQARDDLARLSSAALSIVSQSLRGAEPPVPASEVAQG